MVVFPVLPFPLATAITIPPPVLPDKIVTIAKDEHPLECSSYRMQVSHDYVFCFFSSPFLSASIRSCIASSCSCRNSASCFSISISWAGACSIG